MKKLISVTLAICVALTSLFTGIYAMVPPLSLLGE